AQSGGDAQGDILLNVENLVGSAQGDTIIASAAANVIDGGAGTDVLSYQNSAIGVTIDLRLATAQVSAGDGAGDTISNIENLTGSIQADTLIGGAGGNLILGGGGDDSIGGGSGADTLDGGAGLDTASYATAGAAVTVDLRLTTQTGVGDQTGDVLTNVENVAGSAFDDMLIGSTGDNVITGGDGNDVLEGLAGADTINGGNGIDTLTYANSTTFVNVDLSLPMAQSGGDAEGDALLSVENLVGTSFADTLRGNAADNVITGGDGDDVIEGRVGADTLIGGNGVDTVDYTTSTTGVTVDLAVATAQTSTGDASGDVLGGFESASGSAFADTLFGDAGNNVLMGSGGNDVLVGRAGADTLDGGEGSDTASYASSGAAVTVDLGSSGAQSGGDAQGDVLVNVENVIGSASNDTIIGSAVANVIDGGAGTDVLSYQNSAIGVAIDLRLATAQVSSGDGAGDVVSNIEHLTGSIQADTLIGGAGGNLILGGGGDDSIDGGSGADTLDGGAGLDTVSYATAGAAVTVDLRLATQTGVGDQTGDVLTNFEDLAGSAFDDTLTGSTGDNVLTGGEGNDLLQGLAGADTLTGGNGVDTATYASSGSAVSVDLNLPWAQSGGDADGDVLIGIENLTGSDHADRLRGNVAANLLRGGAGDDVLEGRAGADTLDGGAGSDTVSYSGAGAGVTVDLGLSTAQGGTVDEAGDVLSNFENMQGSAYGDLLTGDGNANTLDGDAGNDTLRGGGGADLLLGNLGDDALDGGTGSDTLNGGEGVDVADYTLSNAAVTVDLRLTGAQGGGGTAVGDVLVDVENVRGSTYNDTLIGNDGANTLFGGDGDDVLIGAAGSDRLDGGNGIDRADYSTSTAGLGIVAWLDGTVAAYGDSSGDVLVNVENLTGTTWDDTLGASSVANVIEGGAGTDLVSYRFATSAVTVDLALATQTGTGWQAGDRYANVEGVEGSGFGDTMVGNASANLLYGLGGNDSMSGGAGDDVVDGGAGDDTLNGGAGADALVGGTGTDTVTYAGGGSVGVDLRSMWGYAGEAGGDTYSGIERWIGSSTGDTFYLGASTTYIDGGTGNDHVTYESSNAGVTVDLSLTTVQVSAGFASGDTLISIESVTGSWYHADTFIGSNGDEGFYGLYGDDTINGGGGNDWMRPDWGADYVDGGTGYDTYDASGGSDYRDTVTLYVDGTSATGGYPTNGDRVINVERVWGGDANETVVASTGLVRFDGNGGVDAIDFVQSLAGVTVDLNLTTQVSAGLASGFVLTGVEAVGGTSAADTLTGDGSDNLLMGRGGADSLYGNGGNDTFGVTAGQVFGGGANLNRVDGGSGYDALEISGLSAGSSVDLSYLTGNNGSGQQVATSIEQIGIRDGAVQTLTISAADVQAMVGQGDASVLTVRADNGDFVNVTNPYTVETAGATIVYSDAARTQQIAQINYLTV
ncbi:MAG: hypothetical protein RJA99_3650, partial [Pseudomonadota bacterium]